MKRLVGFMALNDNQIKKINANYPFPQPLTIPAGSYPGQPEPQQTVGSFSFLLARPDLPEELAYSLTKAIYQGQPNLVERLTQGRDTLPGNTWKAAGNPDRIQPGARRCRAELGV